MLSSMRNKKLNQIILWIVIFAFLATIVVVWGLGEKSNDPSYIARVDDYVIYHNEYTNAYEQTLAQMRQIFGNNADDLIRNDNKFGINVLDTIINNRLLLMEAERIKLPVSDSEVIQIIMSSPLFTVNGEFDIDQYQAMLQYYRTTPEVYETQLKRDLTINKMKQLVGNSVAVTDEELWQEFIFQNTSLSASYFMVPDTAYMDKNEPNPGDLADFFEANIETYRQPAQIKLKYIKFDSDNYTYDFAPTDAELLARYTAAIGQYTTPASVDLSQIIQVVGNWNDEEIVKAAEEKMNMALEELRKGAKFADVATKYSEMPGPDETGYIGTIVRPAGQLTGIDAFIFSLDDNETSEIFKSEFGYHIFRVENRKEEIVVPFEAVKKELADSMYAEAKASSFRSYLYSTYREIMNTGNISAYMQKNPDTFTVGETNAIVQGDQSFFNGDTELEKLLFSLGKTEITPPVEHDGFVYIYELTEKKNSYLPELDEVRNQVTADFRKHKSFNAMMSAVNEAVPGAPLTAAEFAALAKQFKANVGNIPAFTRTTPVQEHAWLSNLTAELFKHSENDVIIAPVEEQQGVYIIRVNAVTPPDESDLTSAKDAIEGYLLSVKQEDALRSYIAELKKRYKVEINPSFTGNR